MDTVSPWFPPISFHALSTTFSHLGPARRFATLSHTALLAMAGDLFLGHAPYAVLPFQLSLAPICFLSGLVPSSARNTL